MAKPKKQKLKIIPVKTNNPDRAALAKKAKDHAGGNVSAWLRHAGLKYIPQPGEAIAVYQHQKSKK